MKLCLCGNWRMLIMIREFNSLEEIEEYYDKETNTYIFKEYGEHIDLVIFNFNLNVDANIEVWNINAWNIDCLNINADNINAYYIKARDITASNIKTYNLNAWHINCLDINAWDIVASDINAGDIVAHDIYTLSVNANNINAINIKANDISYYAICVAYNNIKCKSITGKRENHKHFVLDGVLEIEEDE